MLKINKETTKIGSFLGIGTLVFSIFMATILSDMGFLSFQKRQAETFVVEESDNPCIKKFYVMEKPVVNFKIGSNQTSSEIVSIDPNTDQELSFSTEFSNLIEEVGISYMETDENWEPLEDAEWQSVCSGTTDCSGSVNLSEGNYIVVSAVKALDRFICDNSPWNNHNDSSKPYYHKCGEAQKIVVGEGNETPDRPISNLSCSNLSLTQNGQTVVDEGSVVKGQEINISSTITGAGKREFYVYRNLDIENDPWKLLNLVDGKYTFSETGRYQIALNLYGNNSEGEACKLLCASWEGTTEDNHPGGTLIRTNSCADGVSLDQDMNYSLYGDCDNDCGIIFNVVDSASTLTYSCLQSNFKVDGMPINTISQLTAGETVELSASTPGFIGKKIFQYLRSDGVWEQINDDPTLDSVNWTIPQELVGANDLRLAVNLFNTDCSQMCTADSNGGNYCPVSSCASSGNVVGVASEVCQNTTDYSNCNNMCLKAGIEVVGEDSDCANSAPTTLFCNDLELPETIVAGEAFDINANYSSGSEFILVYRKKNEEDVYSAWQAVSKVGSQYVLNEAGDYQILANIYTQGCTNPGDHYLCSAWTDGDNHPNGTLIETNSCNVQGGAGFDPRSSDKSTSNSCKWDCTNNCEALDVIVSSTGDDSGTTCTEGEFGSPDGSNSCYKCVDDGTGNLEWVANFGNYDRGSVGSESWCNCCDIVSSVDCSTGTFTGGENDPYLGDTDAEVYAQYCSDSEDSDYVYDYNNDGVVDVIDFVTFRNEFLSGVVDVIDFVTFRSEFLESQN